MTEWWLIIALFWVWFLADCLKASRHSRFFLSAPIGGRRAHAREGRAFFSFPLPSAWQALTDDPPYSFSPDGLSNLPACSAGSSLHEPGVIRAWRWEDIKEIAQKRGRILINGADFCAVTVFGDARSLRSFVDRCTALSPQSRTLFLSEVIARWFRPAHLRRRLMVVFARTRDVASLGIFNFTLALLTTVYLLVNGPAIVGDAWAARIANGIPLIAGYFVIIHLAILVLAWRVHRKLRPQHSEERIRLLLNAAMLPPHALRLRAQIAASAFPAQHVLSWLTAAGRPDDLARFTRAALADLRWPLPPRFTVPDDPALLIAAWMRLHAAPHIQRLVVQAGLRADQLLAPPIPDGPASCLYCPRCRDQFTQPGARCPRGVTLLALK